MNFDRAEAPQTVENFVKFVAIVRQVVPKCQFLYLEASVTPLVVLRGREMVAKFEHHNTVARERLSQMEGVEFVPSSAFQRDHSMYLCDQHHLNEKGHQNLAKALAPAIRRCFEKKGIF